MNSSSRRQFVKVLTGISAIGVLSGCLSSGPVKNTSKVEIREDGFSPNNVHIEAQKSLNWVNKTDTIHTVTSATKDWQFDTELKPGYTVQETFNYGGVYKVVCTKHGSKEDFTGERMKISVGSAKIEDPVE